jgi:uncharacterized protein YkwD
MRGVLVLPSASVPHAWVNGSARRYRHVLTKLMLTLLAAASLVAALASVASAARIDSSAAVTPSLPAASRAGAEGACPSDIKLDAAAAIQEQTMLCLTNLARTNAGESPLEPAPDLTASAAEKANDLLACDEFSHYACGREFTYWIREAGYLSVDCWRVGENLAWGTGEYGSVNSIFRAWMHSPEHRKNILGDYRQIGIDLEIGSLGGLRGVHIWTQHFGTHCDG